MAKPRLPSKEKMREAAAIYFALRSHDAWRRELLKTNPEQKGRARMRMRQGVMVDVNQPWSRLAPEAKADNLAAAYDAFDAVMTFPGDREAAADLVHRAWIKRNKSDPSQPKVLFRAYRSLSEVEKDKDRAHVDRMKLAIKAVGRASKKPAKPSAPHETLDIDARARKRLQRAASDLSKRLGWRVSAQVLLDAGVEAALCIAGAVDAPLRGELKKKTRNQ